MSDTKRVLLLGDSGCGKSLVIRHLLAASLDVPFNEFTDDHRQTTGISCHAVGLRRGKGVTMVELIEIGGSKNFSPLARSPVYTPQVDAVLLVYSDDDRHSTGSGLLFWYKELVSAGVIASSSGQSSGKPFMLLSTARDGRRVSSLSIHHQRSMRWPQFFTSFWLVWDLVNHFAQWCMSLVLFGMRQPLVDLRARNVERIVSQLLDHPSCMGELELKPLADHARFREDVLPELVRFICS